MKVELISWTKDPIKTIAQAASTCYESKPSLKIVRGCIQSGHHSVLEFANFVFRISGIDRSVSHQLIRHRIASYAQKSQRYVSMDDVEFICPSTQSLHEQNLYNQAFGAAATSYKMLLDIGVKKEDARAVMPNACPTEICVSMNLRSLSHFMNERLCMRAQKPIREMAKAMVQAIKDKQKEMELSDEEIELIQSLFVPKCESGKIKYCPEAKGCGRHKTAREINSILDNNKSGDK